MNFKIPEIHLSSVKSGLLVGILISNTLALMINFFEINAIFLILILYLYPVTGLISAYLGSKEKKHELRLDRGYHG